MESIEHPQITRVNWTGYPNTIDQTEHFGIDFSGDEILIGEDYIEDTNTEEIILRDNLERYLDVVYNFKFKTAK